MPATTSISALAGRHRPLEVRSRHSPPVRLSRHPRGRQRHPRLREQESATSAVQDTNGQDSMTPDTAILMSHRLRKDNPRARPRARARRRSSSHGDRKARVPRTVLRPNTVADIGIIGIRVAGAKEVGGDCSADQHREAIGRTGMLSITRPRPMLKLSMQ